MYYQIRVKIKFQLGAFYSETSPRFKSFLALPKHSLELLIAMMECRLRREVATPTNTLL